MTLRGLGTASNTGTPQPLFGLANMAPGNCCYDPNRPSWLPSWAQTPTEKKCIADTNNCSVASIAWNGPLPAISSSPVNDPNGTSDMLTIGQPTQQDLQNASVQAAVNSATGLTPGGCPPGEDGTYPDCGTCAWYQTGTYPTCDSSNSFNLLLIGLAALAVGVTLFGGRR